jgi:hypothetical protein
MHYNKNAAVCQHNDREDCHHRGRPQRYYRSCEIENPSRGTDHQNRKNDFNVEQQAPGQLRHLEEAWN